MPAPYGPSTGMTLWTEEPVPVGGGLRAAFRIDD